MSSNDCRLQELLIQKPAFPTNGFNIPSKTNGGLDEHQLTPRIASLSTGSIKKGGKNENSRNSNNSRVSSGSIRRSNRDRRRYECPKCPYATDRRDLFTRHENIHRDEKPFRCYVCNKMFNRADHVKKHFLRIHKGLDYDVKLTRRVRGVDYDTPTIGTNGKHRQVTLSPESNNSQLKVLKSSLTPTENGSASSPIASLTQNAFPSNAPRLEMGTNNRLSETKISSSQLLIPVTQNSPSPLTLSAIVTSPSSPVVTSTPSLAASVAFLTSILPVPTYSSCLTPSGGVSNALKISEQLLWKSRDEMMSSVSFNHMLNGRLENSRMENGNGRNDERRSGGGSSSRTSSSPHLLEEEDVVEEAEDGEDSEKSELDEHEVQDVQDETASVFSFLSLSDFSSSSSFSDDDDFESDEKSPFGDGHFEYQHNHHRHSQLQSYHSHSRNDNHQHGSQQIIPLTQDRVKQKMMHQRNNQRLARNSRILERGNLKKRTTGLLFHKGPPPGIDMRISSSSSGGVASSIPSCTYDCEVCGCSFRDFKSLHTHRYLLHRYIWRRQHNPHPYPCALCGFRASSGGKKAMMKHMMSHVIKYVMKKLSQRKSKSVNAKLHKTFWSNQSNPKPFKRDISNKNCEPVGNRRQVPQKHSRVSFFDKRFDANRLSRGSNSSSASLQNRRKQSQPKKIVKDDEVMQHSSSASSTSC